MKEEMFLNPERTRCVYNKVIEKHTKRLEIAKKVVEKKGEDASPIDLKAVMTEELIIELTNNNLQTFEEELERRNKTSQMSE